MGRQTARQLVHECEFVAPIVLSLVVAALCTGLGLVGVESHMEYVVVAGVSDDGLSVALLLAASRDMWRDCKLNPTVLKLTSTGT